MDGKLWRENRKKNFFGVCLVEWGGMKINGGGPCVFSLSPSKSFLPKMERKLKGENEAV